MEQFASGWKQNYYGKSDVSVYRIHGNTLFAANVQLLIYGSAFWPTYTTGDNTGLIATDSMKNFIQRETASFEGSDLEGYCRFLADKFLARYPQVEGTQVSASEVHHGGKGGPETLYARTELTRTSIAEAVSGIRGFRLLRLRGSSFTGFVRDEYTTLAEASNRPLRMALDLEWTYTEPEHCYSKGIVPASVRDIVHDVFATFESGSIQQVMYRMGTRILAEVPQISEVHLEGRNQTWDGVMAGDGTAIYTEARPPEGCLGLRLRR